MTAKEGGRRARRKLNEKPVADILKHLKHSASNVTGRKKAQE